MSLLSGAVAGGVIGTCFVLLARSMHTEPITEEQMGMTCPSLLRDQTLAEVLLRFKRLAEEVGGEDAMPTYQRMVACADQLLRSDEETDLSTRGRSHLSAMRCADQVPRLAKDLCEQANRRCVDASLLLEIGFIDALCNSHLKNLFLR